MNNMERYITAFTEIFQVEPTQLNQDFTVKNTNEWDSMTHIMLISTIEEVFDIMFDGDDIIEFDSFTKGIEILKSYGIEF